MEEAERTVLRNGLRQLDPFQEQLFRLAGISSEEMIGNDLLAGLTGCKQLQIDSFGRPWVLCHRFHENSAAAEDQFAQGDQTTSASLDWSLQIWPAENQAMTLNVLEVLKREVEVVEGQTKTSMDEVLAFWEAADLV